MDIQMILLIILLFIFVYNSNINFCYQNRREKRHFRSL